MILDETCVEPNLRIGDTSNVTWIGDGFDAGTALARPVLFAQLERLLRLCRRRYRYRNRTNALSRL